MRKNKGITLIALVITIIILIILAGITLNLVLEKNGILAKAKYAKEQTTIESIRERLEMVKGTDYIKEKGNSSIDTYFISLEKEKIEPYIITYKEKITNSTGIVEVDNKYSFLITIENNQNINIEYEGEVGKIDRTEPTIDITITGKQIQNSLPATLIATITSNGESINQAKWILNTSDEVLGTEESSYTQETNGTINLELDNINVYYLHTLTVDNYGRKKETIKGPITVSKKTHKHTSSCTITCTETVTSTASYFYEVDNCWIRKNTWTHSKCGKKTVTSTEVVSGYIGAATHKSTHTVYTCGKTTSTLEGYNINY